MIESDGQLMAGGGWSRRRTLFGGDQTKAGADPLLNATEPARIRAFFVDPRMARRGLGRQLMNECIRAAQRCRVWRARACLDLPGEPLYLATGFSVIERFELALPGNIFVPVTKMRLTL